MRILSDWHKNSTFRAYTAAVVLHVLLFVFGKDVQETLFQSPPASVSADSHSEPMRFEFVDVQDEASDEAPDTPLASHQNQNSRDLSDSNLPQSEQPSSTGFLADRAQLEQQIRSETSPDVRPSRPTENQQSEQDKIRAEDAFDFADVLKVNPKQVQRAQERAVYGSKGAPRETVPFENENTRALERGGLQLSTYAWDFAPYLAYLKRHINRHIYPPRAFDLGLIDGTTQLKFRIYRDGRLEGPELITSKGSAMLKDTSLKAVELSAPYRELPKDFPDDYLEIVGTFEYVILRAPE